MKYKHASIRIETPVEGHYIIHGHNPAPVLTDAGHVVPMRECYITDEIPDEALEAVLQDRESRRGGGAIAKKRNATKGK